MPVTSTTVAVVAMAASVATQVVPVTSVEAIVQNAPVMVQEQHCTNVVQGHDNGDRSVIGGIIGGIVGSQIGHDQNTRRIMTGVGAIVGTQIGSQHNTHPHVRYSTHCAPSYVQRAVPTVTGYRISYVVDGVMQSTIMSYNPGSHITLQRTYSVR